MGKKYKQYVVVFQWVPKMWIEFVWAASKEDAESWGRKKYPREFALAEEVPEA